MIVFGTFRSHFHVHVETRRWDFDGFSCLLFNLICSFLIFPIYNFLIIINQYDTRVIESPSSSSSPSECSAQGQVLHFKRGNLGCSPAEGRSSTANSETKAAVLPWLNSCGSFPLISALHSLFSIWTDLRRSEKILGASTWSWGEWIWLTGHSGLHRNLSQGLN